MTQDPHLTAALALEQVVIVALRDPSLTPEEREILEEAVRVARVMQKRFSPPEAKP